MVWPEVSERRVCVCACVLSYASRVDCASEQAAESESEKVEYTCVCVMFQVAIGVYASVNYILHPYNDSIPHALDVSSYVVAVYYYYCCCCCCC